MSSNTTKPVKKIFVVSGYWKSDKEKFRNYGILIGKQEELTDDLVLYDDVFFTCETEEELRNLMNKDNGEDFVLTHINQ